MRAGPSKIAEAMVAVLVPPACREEVLGDLHERYSSRFQYGWDALRTVPLVILSRIRRTADPQVLLQAFVLYVSFLGAARLEDAAFLNRPWALLRLAIPAVIAMLGLMLEDAYAKPEPRSRRNLTRGPIVGVGLAIASQGMFRIGNPELALPAWITLYGCAMSFLLSVAVRMLFPPVTDQLQGANVPTDWLKRSRAAPGNSGISIRFARELGVIVAAVILLMLFVAYQLWKPG